MDKKNQKHTLTICIFHFEFSELPFSVAVSIFIPTLDRKSQHAISR